ncbi:MAG TPA: TonB-dependent receptor [Rhizomicrobium sp.]|jgi:outer membrane receptor protein involved in Fe transport|nr:TonB-dependent receptor [Rhizomicrobium sp.]
MLGLSTNSRTRLLLLTSTMLTTGLLSGAAQAAAAAAANNAIETVVVTAEKRSEDIQQAPLSIQALPTKKLEELQISNFADYVKFLPSVTYTVGGAGGGNGGPSFANVSMRGVSSGNDGNHSGSLPTVGIYLDEQPITTIGGALDVHVYDIARVESLSGPQGTLYGASSEAGTIRIITNKPDPSVFSAAYDVKVDNVDHGGFGYGGEGFVNIPLSDNMAVRLVGFSEHDAGYIDNVPGTRFFPTSGVTVSNASLAKNNFNSTDSFGGRAALEFDLDADWTITPTIIAQHTQTSGVFSYDPSVGDLKVQHFFPEYTHDTWIQTALTIQGKIANLDVTYSGGYMDRSINAASDYTDYSFFYDTLYGYGAYVYDNHGNFIDPQQYILEKDHFTKMSHELRVATPQDYWLRFVGGLFYEVQNHYILQNYTTAGLSDENADPGVGQLSVPGWPGTLWLTNQERHDTDYAVFGEVSADLFKGFTLTLGGRGFIAHNSLRGFFGFSADYSSHTGVSQCFSAASVHNAPCTDLNAGVTEGGFSHKINATYHIDDSRMVYATWSSGFRPGGINRRGGTPYAPDRLTNYEIGAKTSWFDNRLIANAAIYREDWNNFQFSFLGANSFTEIHNAGAARIYGWEGNITAQPIDGLTLNGSASYNDSHLTKPYCGNVGVTVCPGAVGTPTGPEAPIGTPLPTPKFKTNWTARYEFPLLDFTAHVQGSLVYQSGSWSDLRVEAPNPVTGVFVPIRAALGRQDAYTTADFTLGIDNEKWAAELFILNAFDTRADLYNYAECTVQVCGAEPYRVPNQPRTIGLKFSEKF